MSLNGFETCRVLEPGPSPSLALLLCLLVVAAAAMVLAAPWHWAIRAGLVLVLVLACADAVRTHAWRRGRRAWVCIRRLGNGRWRLIRADGKSVQGALHPDSFVHPWLVVVGVAGGHGWPVFVPVPTDALPHAGARRLRVWLRWGDGAG